jgi:predicted metal-binding membrane protein
MISFFSLRREEKTTAALLFFLAVLAWTLTLWQSRLMSCSMCHGMSLTCPMCMEWGRPFFLRLGAFLGMWETMMAAMMLPSIVPMILLFDRVVRHRSAQGGAFVPLWIFVAGYLAAWALTGVAGFAAVRLVQWGLGSFPILVKYGEGAAGMTLLSAGLYNLSPLKNRCLHHCQTPLDFITEHWREGRWGALRMGLSHGLYCIGCCFGLMLVLFAVGLMNLIWMAGLTVVMSIEKLSPRGALIGRMAGFFLLGIGTVLLLRPSLLHSLI